MSQSRYYIQPNKVVSSHDYLVGFIDGQYLILALNFHQSGTGWVYFHCQREMTLKLDGPQEITEEEAAMILFQCGGLI